MIPTLSSLPVIDSASITLFCPMLQVGTFMVAGNELLVQ